MSDLSDVIRILPPMKSGSTLLYALELLPEYDAAICDADIPVRLMSLSDLHRVYVPNQMSNVDVINQLPLSLCDYITERSCSLGYTIAMKKNKGGAQHTGIVLNVDGMARA